MENISSDEVSRWFSLASVSVPLTKAKVKRQIVLGSDRIRLEYKLSIIRTVLAIAFPAVFFGGLYLFVDLPASGFSAYAGALNPLFFAGFIFTASGLLLYMHSLNAKENARIPRLDVELATSSIEACGQPLERPYVKLLMLQTQITTRKYNPQNYSFNSTLVCASDSGGTVPLFALYYNHSMRKSDEQIIYKFAKDHDIAIDRQKMLGHIYIEDLHGMLERSGW